MQGLPCFQNYTNLEKIREIINMMKKMDADFVTLVVSQAKNV